MIQLIFHVLRKKTFSDKIFVFEIHEDFLLESFVVHTYV